MKEIQKNRSQYSNNKQKNSSLKTIQIQNGSTKATSSLLGNGFLSQEFIVSKDKNQRKKVQNQKISKKQNLFDLERTLDINIEILKNYFKTTTSTMTQPIMEKLEKIIKTHNKKKEIINKIKEKKSKNLIQQQICMEHKRKLEETIEKYKDSLFDNEDAVNNKDEYVKLFQKKFVEVEIYLKRITTDMQDIRRKKYYQNYKMDNFLILNTNLNKKKQKIIEEISKYDSDKRNLKSENQKIKKEEVIEHIKDDENENEIKNEQQELKAKNELIKETYNVLIKDKIDKINILKQFIENHNKIENMIMNKNEIKINSENNNININKVSENKNPMFKKVNVKKVTSERNKINKNKNDEIQKSNLPNDMSKRMDSFMDLSIINSQLKTSVIRGPNNKSILWGDMSAIGKNEDDI